MPVGSESEKLPLPEASVVTEVVARNVWPCSWPAEGSVLLLKISMVYVVCAAAGERPGEECRRCCRPTGA